MKEREHDYCVIFYVTLFTAMFALIQQDHILVYVFEEPCDAFIQTNVFNILILILYLNIVFNLSD